MGNGRDADRRAAFGLAALLEIDGQPSDRQRESAETWDQIQQARPWN